MNQRRNDLFPSAEVVSLGETNVRQNRLKNIIPYGIKFLDDAMIGIFPNDLVVLSARSGVGKTELAAHIAGNAVRLGKRVNYYALEAELYEIESRLKFKFAAQRYFNEPAATRQDILNITYRNWAANIMHPAFEKYAEHAHFVYSRKFNDLRVIYRDDKFTIDDLEKSLALHKDQTDLVVIDHLNYFDFDMSENNYNENRAVQDTIKRIRDLALIHSKPIVLVAHVRKHDRRLGGLIPSIEDIYGTSDIMKIATRIVMLAGDYETKPSGGRFSSFIRIGKTRFDNGTTRYVARVVFDSNRNTYAGEYEIGFLSPDEKEFQPITDPNEWPYWKKNPYQIQEPKPIGELF